MAPASTLRLAPLAIILIGGSIMAAAIAIFHHEDAGVRESLFRLRAQRWNEAISSTLRGNIRALEATAGLVHAMGLVHAEGKIDAGEFASFTHNALDEATALRAVEWIPVVPDEGRAAYESAHNGRQITERSPDGGLVPARPRDRHFPVSLIEPLRGNEAALDYDLGSNPTRLAALTEAGDGAVLRSSAPLKLVQDPDGPPGVLLFLPVYDGAGIPDGIAERQRLLRGYILGVLVPQTVLDHARILAGSSELLITLSDVPDHAQPLPMASVHDLSGAGEVVRDGRLQTCVDTHIGGRTWRFEAVATGAFIRNHPGHARWPLPTLIAVLTLATAGAWWWRDRTHRQLETLVASLGTANAELAQRDRDLCVFQAVINQAPIGICITDRQRRLRYGNPEFLAQTGRDLDAWTGKDPFAGITDPGLDAGRSWSGEINESGPGGTERIFDIIVARLSADDGSRSGLVGFRHDITATRLAQAEARQRNDELLIADKMASLGTLAAGIAHEINTPIQFIGDNLHFLGDAFTDRNRALAIHERGLERIRAGEEPSLVLADVANELSAIDLAFLASETPKAIDQSLEGVARVATIVRAMKDFSHPDAGMRSLLDINQALQTTLIVARNEYKYVAEVETDLAADLPQIPCFAGTIQQVLLNLLVNASHAIGDALKARGGDGKGHITLRTRREGPLVVIEVADTGTGIPEPIRHRIFEPFFTTKPIGKGTGQGLNLSRQIIVQRHGGSIDFTSTEGKGTTFTIRLPVEAPSHA